MPQIPRPNYDYKSSVFENNRKLIRYAEDHLKMIDLANNSDTISWGVTKTTSRLKIPIVYHVHYSLKSIISINEDQLPVYGNTHTLELSITTKYPLEPCSAFMLTDVWHPNIRSKGKFKGRVCVNARGLGMTYSLDQIVLRIGEILQFKNYLAEFVRPYPEDEEAAKWVREYAEPNNIINKSKSIFTDDVPLLREKRIKGVEANIAPSETGKVIEIRKPKIKIKGRKDEEPSPSPKEAPNEETKPQKIVIKSKKNKNNNKIS